MKTFSSLLAVLVLSGLAGCNRSQPGGGAKRSTEFTINGPVMATSIRQGEERTISLKVDRGSEFKQDVKLQAEAPTGIIVSLSETTVKPSEKGDVNLNVVATNTAAPGEQVIHVKATPDTGTATTLDVKVKVTERSEGSGNVKLTLRSPSTTLSLKQGETRSVKVSLEPNSKFQPAVLLHAEAPKDLKVELMPNGTIKAIEGSDADLRITADKNATLGEHTVRITGTATGASVAAVDIRVKVVAP